MIVNLKTIEIREHYLEASCAARLRQDRQLADCDCAHVLLAPNGHDDCIELCPVSWE
jgi:hypothetical protein